MGRRVGREGGHVTPKAWHDLHKLPEDERIRMIVHHVRDHQSRVGVPVDDWPGKAERYIEKIRLAYPEAVIEGPHDGPVAGTRMFFVSPPKS